MFRVLEKLLDILDFIFSEFLYKTGHRLSILQAP